jgi:hypothetical protein
MSTTIYSADVRARIPAFLAAAQALVDAYFARNFPNTVPPTLSQDGNGASYQRIVSRDKCSEHGSAYCFIDLATGDVLKADSFKRPAKTARSNIFATDAGVSGVGPHGAKYLR